MRPWSWGQYAGHLFITEWGDLAPATDPLLPKPAGYRVVDLNLTTGQVVPFAMNHLPGPARQNGRKPTPGRPTSLCRSFRPIYSAASPSASCRPGYTTQNRGA